MPDWKGANLLLCVGKEIDVNSVWLQLHGGFRQLSCFFHAVSKLSVISVILMVYHALLILWYYFSENINEVLDMLGNILIITRRQNIFCKTSKLLLVGLVFLEFEIKLFSSTFCGFHDSLFFPLFFSSLPSFFPEEHGLWALGCPSDGMSLTGSPVWLFSLHPLGSPARGRSAPPPTPPPPIPTLQIHGVHLPSILSGKAQQPRIPPDSMQCVNTQSKILNQILGQHNPKNWD